MNSARPIRTEPVPLHDHETDTRRFLRETTDRATAFTAVPGRNEVAIEVKTLAAGGASRATPEVWLVVRLAESVLSTPIAGWTPRWNRDVEFTRPSEGTRPGSRRNGSIASEETCRRVAAERRRGSRCWSWASAR